MIDIHLPHYGLDWVPGHAVLLFVMAVAMRIAVPLYFRDFMRARSMRKFRFDPVTEYMVAKKRPTREIYAGPERRKRA